MSRRKEDPTIGAPDPNCGRCQGSGMVTGLFAVRRFSMTPLKADTMDAAWREAPPGSDVVSRAAMCSCRRKVVPV